MKWLPPGKLRHRVAIQTKQQGDPLPTGGAAAGSAAVWLDVWKDVPAAIRGLSGKEVDIARQHSARATHKVTMRYRDKVTPECRAFFNGRVFNISWVYNVEERNFWLELTCTEEQ